MRISVSPHVPAAGNGDAIPLRIIGFRPELIRHQIGIFKPFETPFAVQRHGVRVFAARKRIRFGCISMEKCPRSKASRADRFRRLPEKFAEILHKELLSFAIRLL